jgi:hypothetical protein
MCGLLVSFNDSSFSILGFHHYGVTLCDIVIIALLPFLILYSLEIMQVIYVHHATTY